MSNVANEFGEFLNSVLTAEEGTGLLEMCQGIVKRYKNAEQPEPKVIYVDKDCCNKTGTPAIMNLFSTWKVKLG